jgi:hypothetical protein
MEIVTKFFMIIFTAFLDLVKPTSTIAKPECIKNTKMLATKTHKELTVTVLIFSS